MFAGSQNVTTYPRLSASNAYYAMVRRLSTSRMVTKPIEKGHTMRKSRTMRKSHVALMLSGVALLIAFCGIWIFANQRSQAQRSAGRRVLTASTLPDERSDAPYSLSRGLAPEETARMAELKPLLRSGAQKTQALLSTASLPYALWYDERERRFYLPEGYQLTDDELLQLIGQIDALTVRTVKIGAVGDVLIGGDHYMQKQDQVDGLSSRQRFERLKDEHGGLSYFLGDVTPQLSDDDMTIANLECVLTDSNVSQGTGRNFSAPPSYVSLLSDASIEVACMANNHSTDFLGRGMKDTKTALDSVGITAYRIGDKKRAIREGNGVKVGLLGYTMPARRQGLADGIQKLRDAGCEIVVVSFHWTTSKQGSDEVSKAEQDYAHAAIRNGATLVLGHHKNVLSGLERYEDRMIVYDLGNFLATNVYFEDFKYTMIYQQCFNVFEDGVVTDAGFNIIPCLNSGALGDLPNDGHVHVAEGDAATEVFDRIKRRTPQQELWPLIDGSVYNAAVGK